MNDSPAQAVLATFNFGLSAVRVLGTPDRPMFAVTDLCGILEISNPSKAVQDFPDEEKGITESYTLGGCQSLLTVTEAGLYRLIFRSNKPAAETFRRWVFAEVLPAIRKTGLYKSGAGLGDLDTRLHLQNELGKFLMASAGRRVSFSKFGYDLDKGRLMLVEARSGPDTAPAEKLWAFIQETMAAAALEAVEGLPAAKLGHTFQQRLEAVQGAPGCLRWRWEGTATELTQDLSTNKSMFSDGVPPPTFLGRFLTQLMRIKGEDQIKYRHDGEQRNWTIFSDQAGMKGGAV